MGALLAADRISLTARLGDRLLLESISFQLEPGEFVALVGPSGAGKSTLFKLLNRLKSPSSGQIYFQGQLLESLSPIALRRQVMLVGQDYRLLRMTVQAALHYPLKLQKVSESERHQRVLSWMERLHLPSAWLPRTELELSGGQQQQVAIVRALVTEPRVLLLDEPTSAQDVGTATRLLTTIQTLVKAQGLSVIMSNHQLDLAEQFCDRVLYLDQGRLIQDQPAAATDWQALRQSLVEADATNLAEWGED